MLIKVKVLTEAGEEKIFKNGKDSFEVWVKAKPVMGLANRAVTGALAKYFSVPACKIRLIKGFRETHKIFEIL